MLENYVDKAANGIKSGIGWIRDHKNKIIAGALVGAGTVAGIAVVATVKSDLDDSYLCLEESEVEVTDIDDDEECQDETETDVTVLVVEEK